MQSSASFTVETEEENFYRISQIIDLVQRQMPIDL